MKTYWLLFNESSVLIRKSDDQEMPFPEEAEIAEHKSSLKNITELGEFHGANFITASVESKKAIKHFAYTDMRVLAGKVERELIWFVANSYQLLEHKRNNIYCGRCGSEMRDLDDGDNGKVCSKCSHIIYPRISPATMMAIVRNGKILLARSPRFPLKFYSVLAGFVSLGESLEECCEREVMEEVGIRIKNIRYFASQPWPFTGSLMIGYFADYDSGEIKIDEKEIAEADWFAPDELPLVPGEISLARRMIDYFVSEYN